MTIDPDATRRRCQRCAEGAFQNGSQGSTALALSGSWLWASWATAILTIPAILPNMSQVLCRSPGTRPFITSHSRHYIDHNVFIKFLCVFCQPADAFSDSCRSETRGCRFVRGNRIGIRERSSTCLCAGLLAGLACLIAGGASLCLPVRVLNGSHRPPGCRL